MSPVLALGTAQWGMDYGVANRSGRPLEDEVFQILQAAREADVSLLDTARAYGDSERVIGHLLASFPPGSFSVVTKLSPAVWTPGLELSKVLSRVESSVGESLDRLRVERLETLLLHRVEHLTACSGAIWDRLLALRGQGRIGRLGVSLGSPTDASSVLGVEGVEVVQVPASLLDQRALRSGSFDQLRKAGVEVHVRSVFLQGVAFLAPSELPSHLTDLKRDLERIDAGAREVGVRGPSLWLDHAKQLPVDAVVLGVETVDQIRQNLSAFRRPAIPAVPELAQQVPELPDSLLDPSQWPAADSPGGRSS